MRRHEASGEAMCPCENPVELTSFTSVAFIDGPVTGLCIWHAKALYKLCNGLGEKPQHVIFHLHGYTLCLFRVWRKKLWYNPIGRKTCFGHFGYLKVIFLNLLNFSSTLRGARANYHSKKRIFVLSPRINDLKHSFFLKESVGHLLLV